MIATAMTARATSNTSFFMATVPHWQPFNITVRIGGHFWPAATPREETKEGAGIVSLLCAWGIQKNERLLRGAKEAPIRQKP